MADSPSSREKENLTSNITSQRAEKLVVSEARAKILKERAQETENAFTADNERIKLMGCTTEKEIQQFAETEIRNSRKVEPDFSPKHSSHDYDISHETSWSQFMKWVPWNPTASTLLDKDGYAVPTTVAHSMPPSIHRTPERIKSPDNELFYTPAARISEKFAFLSRPSSSHNNELAKNFQQSLTIESAKIGLITRKTIHGLDNMEQIVRDNNVKSWQSPVKKCRMPQFSGLRQSHPIEKETFESRYSVPGTVSLKSDDEETLDGVSSLHSEADFPRKLDKVEASKLPKLLGAQLQAAISYVETSNKLEEKLNEVENITKNTDISTNLSSILDNIQFLDHSLSFVSPKRNTSKDEAPLGSISTTFEGVERTQALKSYYKSLSIYEETIKRFIMQNKKIHTIVSEEPNSDSYYAKVVDSYFSELKSELTLKRLQAKEKASMQDIEFITWMRHEKREIDNRSNFFKLLFLDVGKFIVKHSIPPPIKSSVKDQSKDLSLIPPAKEVDWEVRVQPTNTEKPDINETSPTKSMVTTPSVGTASSRSSSLGPVTPSTLNAAFFEKASDRTIWDESLKEQPISYHQSGSTDAIDSPDISARSLGHQDDFIQTSLLNKSLLEALNEPKSPQKKENAIKNVIGTEDEHKAEHESLLLESPNEEKHSNSQTQSGRSPENWVQKDMDKIFISNIDFQSPKMPTIPPLELSLLQTSSRASISGSILNDSEELDDFLNRSGRRERYKLDITAINESSEEVPLPKISPKREIDIVLPKSPRSMQLSPKLKNTDFFKNRSQVNVDLNFSINTTSEDFLEDVKKPEAIFDFSISIAANEYEKILEDKEAKWNDFIQNIDNPRRKMEIINKCINHVWKLQEESGGVILPEKLEWCEQQKFQPTVLFDDEMQQKMYESEWFAVLGDVFDLAYTIMEPRDRKTTYPSIFPFSPNTLTKEKFSTICQQELIEKKSSKFVENISHDYFWDQDCSRKNAHEMIYEQHNTYLTKEINQAKEAKVKEQYWQVSEKLLNHHVDTILSDARKSLGRESLVSRNIAIE